MRERRRLAIILGIAFMAWQLAAPAGAAQQAWTLEEARRELELNPNDVFLQYVTLQLARRNKIVVEVAGALDAQRAAAQRNERREQVDVFNIFSGALAIQESLQLDAMRTDEQNSTGKNDVALASLKGCQIESHPWEKMLVGRKPELSALCRCVPEDFCLIEFRSLNKLLEAVEVKDLWGVHLANQATQEARSHRLCERLKQQLAIETHVLLRPFYDLVVDEVAVAGSDLFFHEGSDVSVLFQLKQSDIFKAHMDGFLANAEKARPDCKRTTTAFMDVECVHVVTPDGEIRSHSAYPAPNLHVRSNSQAALERIIAAIKGQDAKGKQVTRLGDTAEFAYIRTLLPRGAKEEDGFAYLSDAFIRNLVGPRIKLTERRRMLCYNNLRMIGHASLLYRTECGKVPADLGVLHNDYAPGSFGRGRLSCPDGGTYALSAEGTTGVCSIHNCANWMTPCCEIPLASVSKGEAEAYERFVTEYNQYWRTYFDPIALRIQITPQQYRIETIVLPLIGNSIYTGLAGALGGKPEPLDTRPVPKRNIFSAAFKINKDSLAVEGKKENASLPLLWLLPDGARDAKLNVVELIQKGLGGQAGFHVYDAIPLLDVNISRVLGEAVGSGRSTRGLDDELSGAFICASLISPAYISLQVADAAIVDKFLESLDAVLPALARKPDPGGFLAIKGDFYTLALPDGVLARAYTFGLGPIKYRIFWARIDDTLYIASKTFILEDIMALRKAPAEPAHDAGPPAHALVRLRARNWNACLPDFRLGWAENNRQACLSNAAVLSSAGRAWLAATSPDDAKSAEKLGAEIHRHADSLYASHFFCPDGGRYCVGENGKSIACSIHGSAASPRQPPAPADTPVGALMRDVSGITAALTFMEDGLHAVVTVEKK